jgi:hypothetical protein
MSDIFLKAPLWVWPLFAGLIFLGWMQSHSRSMSPWRIIMISCAALCLSGYGVIAAFHGSPYALMVWLTVVIMTTLVCQKMGYPQGWQLDTHTHRIQVPGSWLPMALYLTIFMVKFACGIALALRPMLAARAQFSLPISALYGLLSGIFAARAWHAMKLQRQSTAQ